MGAMQNSDHHLVAKDVFHHPEAQAVKAGSRPNLSIRKRALVLGFVLAIAICVLTPFNNIYRGATPLGGGHFPLAPFYILVWLTVIVALIRSVFKRWDLLTGNELMVAWILMVIGSGIAYTGLARTFFINLTAPFHFATVGNRWSEVLHPLLPKALYPQSPEAVVNFYDGLLEGRQMGWWDVIRQVPWAAWAQPLLIWGIFILACYFVMLCMINLLSRQAMENA